MINNHRKFLDLCREGEIDKLIKFKDKIGITELENYIHMEYEAGLISAIKKNHHDVVNFLIDNGADIHFNNDEPLAIACEYSDIDIVKKLVRNGCDINKTNSPLKLACYKGRLEIVKYLVENGADINSNNSEGLVMACKNYFGYSRFFVGEKSDKLGVINFLIEHGINITSDALIEACKEQNLKLIKLLVENGADIHINNDEPFRVACLDHHLSNPKLVEYFLDNNVNIHIQNDELLLKNATNEDVLKVVLPRVVDPSLINEEVFNIACGSNSRGRFFYRKPNIESVKLLLEYNVNRDVNQGFINATINCHDDIKELLLKKINIPFVFSQICGVRRFKTMKMILDRNIDVDIDSLNTAFSLACRYCDSSWYARYFYSINNNIDIHRNNDESLSWLCYNNNLDEVKWILTLDDIDKFNINNSVITYCLNNKIHIIDKCITNKYTRRSTIDKKTLNVLKKSKNFDRNLYVYVHDKLLHRDELTIKKKVLGAIRIIERFLFNQYYKPGGIHYRKQLKQIELYE